MSNYIFFIQFLIYTALIIPITKCVENNLLPKIVGGEQCDIKQYPFLVSIRSSKNLKHFCGGTLLQPNWVITAHHCFKDINRIRSRSISVVVGITNLNQRKDRQVIPAKRLIGHDGFDNHTFNNDIALIKLTKQFKLIKGSVELTRLPKRNIVDISFYLKGDVTIAGWGTTEVWDKTKPKGSYSDVLKCVNLTYFENESCARYNKYLNGMKMCTISYKPAMDACQGDSGGPLIKNGVQYGIVSAGSGCGIAGRPALYTRLDRYIDYIEGTVRSSVRSITLAVKPRPIATIDFILFIHLIKFITY